MSITEEQQRLVNLLSPELVETYNSNIDAAIAGASKCDWLKLGMDLMSVAWASSELTGKAEAFTRKGLLSSSQRSAISKTLTLLENQMLQVVEETLTKKCNCHFLEATKR